MLIGTLRSNKTGCWLGGVSLYKFFVKSATLNPVINGRLTWNHGACSYIRREVRVRTPFKFERCAPSNHVKVGAP